MQLDSSEQLYNSKNMNKLFPLTNSVKNRSLH